MYEFVMMDDRDIDWNKSYVCGSSKLLPYRISICRLPLCKSDFPPKTVGEDLDPPVNVRFHQNAPL